MNTRQLIDAYHQAWTEGDFTTAREFLADNLDFKGSIDSFSNADDFIAALITIQADGKWRRDAEKLL
jgi:hypothetical protein